MFLKLTAKAIFVLAISIPYAHADSEIKITSDIGYASYEDNEGVFGGIGLGLDLNEYLGFQVSYTNYGKVGPTGESAVEMPGVETSSFALSSHLNWPVLTDFSLFGILGYELLNIEGVSTAGSLFQTTVYVDEEKYAFMYGVGGSYNLTNNIEASLKLVSHDSDNLITGSFGLAYIF
ncbi:outer membrane beta-barrel protein [Saccharophagus degradans]|uniref:outer membrane beta-barrel protein n=1 Tax=Saccharophagus degradans TaxID=86304 RepID=UPI001C080BE0|nr:outer membrane beta-barrel protein [Saccharophagus degradans]MBU2983728.1 outer membrane beta-barrel protein [Saccharophagus degradans]WGO97862.1 outer membrane beta-barrel protein [Saccharophagus degradans]